MSPGGNKSHFTGLWLSHKCMMQFVFVLVINIALTSSILWLGPFDIRWDKWQHVIITNKQSVWSFLMFRLVRSAFRNIWCGLFFHKHNYMPHGFSPTLSHPGPEQIWGFLPNKQNWNRWRKRYIGNKSTVVALWETYNILLFCRYTVHNISALCKRLGYWNVQDHI